MKTIFYQDVFSRLSHINALENGFLKRTIDSALGFYEFTIEDAEGLFNLIWHYRESTQILTPGRWYGGRLYTVRQVAQLMIDRNLTFDGLFNGTYEGKYDPNWFKSCAKIDANFSWSHYSQLVVQVPSNVERIDCPSGTFRLIDGLHRSLVAAVKLLRHEIEFEPIKVIFVIQPSPKLFG